MSDTVSVQKTGEEGIILYCANHPTVETSLRCNRCEKPICAKCAIATPTGYRCKECVRGQQKLFETAQWYDYPVAFVLAVVLAAIGSIIGSFIWFFIILLAPAVGVVIAEAVRTVLHHRRSIHMWQVVEAGTVIGCLPMLFASLLRLNLFGILFQGAFMVIATSTAIARLRGININR